MSRLEAFLFFAAAFIGGIAPSASTPEIQEPPRNLTYDRGAIVRGDTERKELALVFTGHEFADGGDHIAGVLKEHGVSAGFFFTGDFYRAADKALLIKRLRGDGHYLGPHSDKHLLYCSWENRDTLLVTKDEFASDILRNFDAMGAFDVDRSEARCFIPPYEWYNEAVAAWAQEMDLVFFNFSPGTVSNADYTTPDLPNYRSSEEIFRSIFDYEKSDPRGLNGFILLLHVGAHPDRKDKFYLRLDELVTGLRNRGYAFVRIDRLLGGERQR